jgi:hypothetical protein
MDYVVHPDKVETYLLNPLHKAGGGKAQFFMSKRFTTDNPAQLAEALKRHPVEATLRNEIPNLEGRKLIYECDITTPDGSRTCIRSVWVEAKDGSQMRLVTAYPFQ